MRALAQHAETTLEAIGHDKLPVVREIFRNLVTAEGTRIVFEFADHGLLFGKPYAGRIAISLEPN